MSQFATHPDRVAAPNHRAQVLAEAVVSAYIDEIARSGRRQHRPASAPSRTATAPTPAAACRAPTRRRRPLAAHRDDQPRHDLRIANDPVGPPA
jgi:hypothetical protein